MRKLTAVLVLSLAACGGDDDTTLDTRDVTTVPEVEWLDQWEPFTDVVQVDGVTVGVKEDEGTIYVQDCDTARALTEEGGAYGSAGGEAGYGYICE